MPLKVIIESTRCMTGPLAQSSTASNETFNYKQALQERDYHEFVKAMVNEVGDHESRAHWTLTKCCDLPSGTKTIMSI